MKKIIAALAIAMIVPSAWAKTFVGKVVGVADGDTVTALTEQSCKSGKVQYRIRLAETDFPGAKAILWLYRRISSIRLGLQQGR